MYFIVHQSKPKKSIYTKFYNGCLKKMSTVILTFQIYKIFIFVKIKAIKKYT